MSIPVNGVFFGSLKTVRWKKNEKNSHLKTTFIRVQILMVALSTTTSSLQKCFSGTSRKIIYPNLWN
jgi:hypothetical protein